MKKTAIGLASGLATILAFARPAFAQTPIPTQTMIGIFVPTPVGIRTSDLGKIISSTFAFLLIVAGLLAFAFLIVGGIQWITSGGDKAGLEGARNRIIHAVVGVIVVFSAWAITLLIQQFLGITILGQLSIPTAY